MNVLTFDKNCTDRFHVTAQNRSFSAHGDGVEVQVCNGLQGHRRVVLGFW